MTRKNNNKIQCAFVSFGCLCTARINYYKYPHSRNTMENSNLLVDVFFFYFSLTSSDLNLTLVVCCEATHFIRIELLYNTAYAQRNDRKLVLDYKSIR